MTKEEIILANQELLFPTVFHYYREPLVMVQTGWGRAGGKWFSIEQENLLVNAAEAGACLREELDELEELLDTSLARVSR